MSKNPYFNQSMRAVSDACMKAAGALDPGKKRSEAGTEKLHGRLRLLLIVAGSRLSPDFFAAEPVRQRTQQDFNAGALSWLDKRNKESRYRVLVAAADHALGGANSHTWLRDAQCSGLRVTDLALSSDEGLRQVLDYLKAIKQDTKP